MDLQKDGIPITAGIYRRGQSVGQTAILVDELLHNGVRLIFIKKNMELYSGPEIQSEVMVTMVGFKPLPVRCLRTNSMKMSNIPFSITDWSEAERTEHKCESGIAVWRTREFGGIRVRMVEYSPGYRADHWCSKGHILLCKEGELHTVLSDGRKFTLTPGVSYQVADNAEPHRSFTGTGAKLFIVD